MKYHKKASCVDIFILNRQKCHFSLFSSTKLENRRVEQVLPGVGDGTSGRREVAGKRYRRVNMMHILSIHICKCENDICCKYLKSRGGRIKESGGGGEFKYDIFSTLYELL
jgi:predicted nucleotidyltransferase